MNSPQKTKCLAALPLFFCLFAWLFVTPVLSVRANDYDITIGSEFQVSASDVLDANGSPLQNFPKKPKVYIKISEIDKKKICPKVINFVDGDTTATCQWTKKISNGTYLLYVQPKIPKQKVGATNVSNDFVVQPPSITSVTRVSQVEDVVTYNIAGTFLGTKKPKVWITYEDPETLTIKKKPCKVTVYDNDHVVFEIKGAPDLASTLYLKNLIAECTAPLNDSSKAQFTMVVSPEGSGTTVPAAGTTTVNTASAIDITGTPTTGYSFVNWTASPDTNVTFGDANSSATTATLSGDTIVTANFLLNSYTLTYNAGANGSVTGTTPQTVDYGSDGTAVTAEPATGYHFVDWSDACTDNPRTDTDVTADITVTANFAINTYSLTYTAGAGGTVDGTTPQTVDYGSDGTAMTANPDVGYHFVDWSDACADNPRTDTNVTGDITVTANFAINTYTLTYTAGAGGSVNGTTPQTVDYGSDGTAVTAVPDTGYHFVDWSDACADNPRTDTDVTAGVTVSANFAINTYTVTFVTDGTAGSSLTGDAAQTVDYDSDCTAVTANAPGGYVFSGWTGDFTSSDNPLTVTNVTADMDLTANFTQVSQLTMAVSPGGAGTTDPEVGASQVNMGSTTDISATAANGYVFLCWSASPAGNVSFGDADSASTTTTVNGDVTVTANFAKIEDSHFGYLGNIQGLGVLGYLPWEDAFNHPLGYFTPFTEVGFKWDRPHPGPFNWNLIEPTEGAGYDFTLCDSYVTAAQANGLEIIATIWPYAEWDQAYWMAQPGYQETTGWDGDLPPSRYKPYDTAAYMAFVQAMVERYDGDGVDDMAGLKYPIKYWEALNEPDTSMHPESAMGFFRSSDVVPDYTDYLEVLENTEQAVHAAYPGAIVANGGATGADDSFWVDLIAAGGGSNFTVGTWHNLFQGENPIGNLGTTAWDGIVSPCPTITEIWNTEFQVKIGEAACPTEKDQAKRIVQGYSNCFYAGADKIFYIMYLQNDSGLVEFTPPVTQRKMASYYSLGRIIELTDFFTAIESVSVGDGINCYKYTIPGGKTVYILWADDAGGGTVNISGLGDVTSITVTNLVPNMTDDQVDSPVTYGSSPVSVSGGDATFDLGDDTPCYFEIK